jgi:hypothetical protein
MTAAEILAAARRLGVDLSFDGDEIVLRCSPSPPASFVDAVRAHKPELLELLRCERRRINAWIDAKLITWPQTHCLHCRLPINVGEKFVDVAGGDERARFHASCEPVWRAEQAAAARAALGLP